MTIAILRCDGTTEQHVIARAGAARTIGQLLGAELLDTVNLRDGRVMLVDDHGYDTVPVTTEHGVFLNPVRALKPVNLKATAIYHSVCRPGTTHEIVGDVVIVNDADFE